MALSKILPAGQDQFAGARNLIINGAMQVAQRGTSFTGFGAAVNYGIDRFANYHSSDGAFTISQETSVVPDDFTHALKILTTTADSSIAAGQRLIVFTRCEGNVVSQLNWGTSAAKTVTLSFYVRSSITGTHGGAFGNGSDDRNYPFTYTINSANTWERKTITVAGDTSGTWATGTGRSLQVVWGLGVGSTYSGTAGAWASGDINSATGATTDVLGTLNATWYITGVQLEVGDVATPFEHRSFAEEWDRCQRYCTVYNVGGGNTHPQNLVSPNHTVPGGGGHNDVANRAEWFMSYPVKRSQPTITVTDPTNMRWLADHNAVQDATGTVSFPVGTGHQNADSFQAVTSLPITEVILGWIYKGSGTYPVITIDSEL